MSAEQHVALVRAWVDAINRNDVEAELARWQPDGQFIVIPTSTAYRGVEELRRAGANSLPAIGDQPVEGRKQITNVFATDDAACVEYDTLADIQGPITIRGMTLIPEGVTRRVQSKVCVVFRLTDGKLQVGREYWDSASITRQLGVSDSQLSALYQSLGATS